MIPLRLQIKNFLSYGNDPVTIDFAPYQFICLSGRNGHGKSALLDALTWAIWGQARKMSGVAKADQHLIRIGQTQMIVVLDFIFNARMYRVKRECALAYGKVFSSVEFGIYEDDLNSPVRPLTDKTIRDTQAVIETTLGLDYDSFVNSSFLRQGNANEFSKKSPKERKEILSSILRLGRYEQLKKLALDKVRLLSIQQERLQKEIERLHAECQQEAECRKMVEEITCKLVEINSELLDQQQQSSSIMARLLPLKQAHEQCEYVKKLQKELAMRYVTACDNAINAYEIVRKQRLHRSALPSQEILNVQSQTVRSALNQFQSTFEQYQIAEQLVRKLQQSLNVLRDEITTSARQKATEYAQAAEKSQRELDLSLHHLARLDADINQLEKTDTLIVEQIASAQEQTVHVQEQLKIYEFHKHRSERSENYRVLWNIRKNECIFEQKQIENELNSLQASNAHCNACNQAVSQDLANALCGKLRSRQKALIRMLERLTAGLQVLETKSEIEESISQQGALAQAKLYHLNDLLAQLQKQKTSVSEKKVTSVSERATAHQAVEANREVVKIARLSYEKIINAAAAYTHDIRYQQLFAQYEDAVRERDKLAYNPEKHASLNSQLQEIVRLQAEHERACFTIQSARRTVWTELQERRRLRMQQVRHEQEIQRYQIALADYKMLETEMIIRLEKIKQLQERKDAALQEQGKYLQQLVVLEQIRKQLTVYEHEQKKIAEDTKEYSLLVNIFGKDGLQALLIEDALPEIEREANILLQKLTDNQSHIMIDSLRDLKKGGSKETLDIKISDQLGVRQYELFSGGEAFRIDFALRIAISKLLAKRAGTSLETLIIDEGFGSQDEEGLQRIMDALYHIQDDFSKIIIVSHLSTLKEQFPVHFVVEKYPAGSSVKVIQYG